jgi:hypothetical protein
MNKITGSQFKRLIVMQTQLAARKKTGKKTSLPLLKSGLVSKKEGFTPVTRETVVVVPPVLTGSPIITGIQLFNPFGGTFWSMFWGTREEKIKAATGLLPFGYQKTDPLTGGTDTQTVQQFFTEKIETQKETIQGAKEYYSERTFGGSETPVPEFPDILGFFGNIGKWVLLGGALILGLYLFKGGKND